MRKNSAQIIPSGVPFFIIQHYIIINLRYRTHQHKIQLRHLPELKKTIILCLIWDQILSFFQLVSKYYIQFYQLIHQHPMETLLHEK